MSAQGRVRTYLILSVTAGAMVVVVTLMGGDAGADADGTERGVLGLAILLTACLGSLSALRPNWRGRLLGRGSGPVTGPSTGGAAGPPGPPRRGHHPECDAFASHVITVRGRSRCAGCTGLLAGSIGIVPLVGLYAARPDVLEPWDGPVLVLVGLALVALDLGVALVGPVGPRAGLGLNALLVVGLALVPMGMLEATGHLGWGLVGLLLGLLWVDARIQLSHWNHVATCSVCPETCVAYPP